MFRRRLRIVVPAMVIACVLHAWLAAPVAAQAWVPPPGEGSVTVGYQNTLARGHLLPTGKRAAGEAGRDPVRAHTLTTEFEFGLSDRIAVSVSLPFVSARYGGLIRHLVDVRGNPTDIDSGEYHSSFQDFRLGARYNLRARPIAITPFVDGIVPSHRYPSRGHAAPGLDLRALVLGTNVGVFLDPVLPRTYVQAQASHAIVQKVAGVRPNRTRVDTEAGYFVTPRLAIRFLESFQRTHEGVDYPYTGLPRILSLNHDRLSRNNFLNLGGGFAYAINESVDVFGVAARLVWGQNVHPHNGFGVGISWHFRTRAAAHPSTPNAATSRGLALPRFVPALSPAP